MNSIVTALALGASLGTLRQEQPPAPTKSEPPAAAASDEQARSLEIFDVSDLAYPSRIRVKADAYRSQFGGAQQRDSMLRQYEESQPQRASESVPSKPSAYRLVEALVRGVATSLDPGATIESKENGALLVRGSRKLRGAVAAVLKSIRGGQDVLPIEMQLIEVGEEGRKLVVERNDGELGKLGVAGSESAGGVVSLTKETLDRLLAQKGCNVLTSPTVSVLPLDVAEMRTTETLSYVAGIETTPVADLGTIVDPILKTLEVGTKVELRAVAATGIFSKEPTLYALRLELEHSVLRRPIETKKTELGVIQLPEVKKATIASTVVASAGSRVLLGGVLEPSFDEHAAGRWLYLLVHVHEPVDTVSVPPENLGSPKAGEKQ